VDLPYGQTNNKWYVCIDFKKMWIEFLKIYSEIVIMFSRQLRNTEIWLSKRLPAIIPSNLRWPSNFGKILRVLANIWKLLNMGATKLRHVHVAIKIDVLKIRLTTKRIFR
jgi:hypothetical protein